MPIDTLDRFEVKYLRIIDENGTADPSVMPPLSDALLKNIFEKIVLARTFNQRALSLQREGRIGTYASFYGQEAAQIGSALAIAGGDWVFPSFRESGVLVALGYPMRQLYSYWSGDERGMQAPPGLNVFPMAVPVGTQAPHGMGAAWAMKYRKERKATVTYFGDGGSSRGDFHEALNLAGVFKAPAVFFCQNNQWAISMPRHRQTAAKTIAQKAIAYGIEGIVVDGNDAVAVYKATADALDRAKRGEGPTLIEAFTYRLDDHTTSDEASRYRTREEVEAWRVREPLIRLRLFMEKKGLWSREYEEGVGKAALDAVDREIEAYEGLSAPEPADMFRYTYDELTVRQKRELKEFGWGR